MKKVLLCTVLLSSSLLAHSAIMSCFDNGDETISCDAAFSDGSSAEGVELYVLQDGKKVYKTKIDDTSGVSFDKPKSSFIVVLDGGEGHKVEVKSSDITE